MGRSQITKIQFFKQNQDLSKATARVFSFTRFSLTKSYPPSHEKGVLTTDYKKPYSTRTWLLAPGFVI